MKIFSILYLIPILTFLSCEEPECQSCELIPDEIAEISPVEIKKDEFQTILDSFNVEGSILLFDPKSDVYYSNDFNWANEQRIPASTFKIPNSIIALELGIVEDENSMFEWDGKDRMMDRWEIDMTFEEALKLSCVPCYQDIARKVGVERMDSMLQVLEFGDMHVTDSTLDIFWLVDGSVINQFEQISFLNQLVNRELMVKNRSMKIVQKMLLLEENNGARLYGKTGWALGDDYSNGWFVGFVEKEGSFYYFATNVSPNSNCSEDEFPSARTNATMKVLEMMDWYTPSLK